MKIPALNTTRRPETITTTGRIIFTRGEKMNTHLSSSTFHQAEPRQVLSHNPVFSEDLRLHYRYHQNRAVIEFEDGVEYSMKEALILARGGAKGHDLQMLHEAKKLFTGVFLTETDLQQGELFNGCLQVGDRQGEEDALVKKNTKSEKTSDKSIKTDRKTSSRKQKYHNPLQTSLWS
jgi:hypothetical protein